MYYYLNKNEGHLSLYNEQWDTTMMKSLPEIQNISPIKSDKGDLPLTHAWPLGASCGPTWISPSKVRFRVWAPHGEKVRIEFEQGPSAELHPEPKAPHFWSADVSQVKAGDRYRIVLSSHWNDCYHTEGAQLIRRDPYAREVDFDTPWCILRSCSGSRTVGQHYSPQSNCEPEC